MIKIKINNKTIKTEEGKTVLEVARENNIDIPALCHHPDFSPQKSCRLCLIEVEGTRGLQTACSTKAKEGMQIKTESEEIRKARKTNLELIFAQFSKRETCSYYNKLMDWAKEYKIVEDRFENRKKNASTYSFGPSVVFESSACIDCHNCVEACKTQVEFLKLEKKGDFAKVTLNPERRCIYCGQCAAHCPVEAIRIKEDIEKVENAISDKNKYVVFQFAPAIRTSIGEEFGTEEGIVTEKLVGAIKALKADKVFDTCVAADVTTIEEAKEFIERIEEDKPLPMFTSCCPSWVRFVEIYYPNFIKNLTTVRSPQIIMGGLIKTYFAKKENINPKDIFVVSIMPCVSKKYERTRNELDVEGLKPVDAVLTTRELAKYLKQKNIDLNTVEECEADNPLGIVSGAGVIYGASGGVMESALRTAYNQLTGKDLENIDLKGVRGMKGLRCADIKINAKNIKIAVATGISNAIRVLEEVKKNPKAYDYVEVMACPGGCIGGGGQPQPTSYQIRKRRAENLYKIDKGKQLRLAHQSPVVKELYEQFFKEDKIIHKICHTKYFPQIYD